MGARDGRSLPEGPAADPGGPAGSAGRPDNRNAMTAPARTARPDDRRDPATDGEHERPAVAAGDPGPPGGAQRVGGQGEERDPERRAAGGQQRDLRGVTDRHRVAAKTSDPISAMARKTIPGVTLRVVAAHCGVAASPCPMVDRHVVRQARPLHPGRDLAPERRRTRRRGTSAASSSDSNVQKQWTTRTLKPFRSNGPVAPAQQAVLGQVAAQPRHVVATVVEQDEQPTTRSQDPGRLGDLGRRRATERGPAG